MATVHTIDVTQLRTYRQNRRLSQRRLGELVGLTQTIIHHYERGIAKPSEANALKISNVLDMPLSVTKPYRGGGGYRTNRTKPVYPYPRLVRVYELVKLHQIKFDTLALRSGYCKTNVVNVCLGKYKPSPNIILCIATVLKTTPEYLLGLTDVT